jgi:hypothetical protein
MAPWIAVPVGVRIVCCFANLIVHAILEILMTVSRKAAIAEQRDKYQGEQGPALHAS